MATPELATQGVREAVSMVQAVHSHEELDAETIFAKTEQHLKDAAFLLEGKDATASDGLRADAVICGALKLVAQTHKTQGKRLPPEFYLQL